MTHPQKTIQAAHLAASNGKISVLDFLLSRVQWLDGREVSFPILLKLICCVEQQPKIEINVVDRMGGTPLEVTSQLNSVKKCIALISILPSQYHRMQNDMEKTLLLFCFKNMEAFLPLILNCQNLKRFADLARWMCLTPWINNKSLIIDWHICLYYSQEIRRCLYML